MAKTLNLAINGCGRIGRKVLRLAIQNPQVQIKAINEPNDLNSLIYLLKYDSLHGHWKGDIHAEGNNTVVINGQKVRVYQERDPAKLTWGEAGAEVVYECTGVFTDKERASAHLAGGAKRVIISAPSKDADATFCIGVNHTTYNPAQHIVISNASCTTNCLAPVVKTLDDAFGVVRGTMTTVHSYTNDQRILDLAHKDLRRARAAALSMIPTSTGAAKAVGLVLPHLKGKLDGLSIRVPTPNVSVVDFVCEVKTATTKDTVNQTLKTASETTLKGILGYTNEPLVSIDFNGDTRSSIVDSAITMVIGSNMIKVISWYDNESGFSQRMVDLGCYIAEKGI